MRLKRLDSRKLALVLLAAFVWVGCNEQETVTDPEGAQPAGVPAIKNVVAALECTADVKAESLSCGVAEGLQGVLDPRFLIVGGQGVFVHLISTNVMYDDITEIFSADVTVGNLLGQLMGTPDGSTVTGVKVFFHSGPSVTSGAGTVVVRNPDGFGTFTGVNQPFHNYDQILSTPAFAPDHRTDVKNWAWDVQPTVLFFVFEVLVQADVPGENGYAQPDPTKALLNLTDMTSVDLNVTVFDAVSRPTGGLATWSSGDPTIATVNTNTGVVNAASGGRVEITATTGGPEADGVSVITVDEAGYQVEVVFLTPVTASVEAAFDAAAARWEGIITGDVGGVSLTTALPECGGGPIDEFVDDVVIRAVVGPIDGVGGILGQAGPCFIRTVGSLPVYGVMIFDEDDLADLELDNQLEDVILHEMGHVLGYGTIWPLLNLILDTGGGAADCATPSLTDPYFPGALANTAFDNAGGAGYVGNTVPVEAGGGPGTRCGHWRETVFETELMTGFISAPGTPNPLSAISIQSMADMGYTVDVGQADAYMLPGAPLGPVTGGLELVDDIWRGAVYTVDENGNMVEILPDRRPDWLKQLDLSRSR